MIGAMDVLGRGDVCEHCHETDYCSYCLPWSTHHRYDNVKPGCYVCRNAFQTRIDALRMESTRLKDSYEAKVAFLMLRDPAKADESLKLKGDVTLAVNENNEQLIHSHRFILADKSSVFRKMFETDMLEKQTGIIQIDDATFPVMRSVISFCYTAEIQFSEEVPAEEVLKVAHKYAIDHLRDVCAEELTKNINKESLPQMLRLAKRFDAKGLQDAAAKFFKENFDSVFPNVLNEL
ncbi:unnamed protein product [Calypogeia fissa]